MYSFRLERSECYYLCLVIAKLFNCSCSGQTGAGKTFTIFGKYSESQKTQNFLQNLSSGEKGLLPRALQTLFNESKRKKDSRISISFFQIYNEKIYDLLAIEAKPLQLRQTKANQIQILGLTEFEVVSIQEALSYLADGIKNRATSPTILNVQSSRSHSIFHIKYERLVPNKQQTQFNLVVGHLRIIDLAGSEKFNIDPFLSPQERQLKVQELKSINGSLSQLGQCISALSNSSKTHIPFRSSKLTRILQESFLGHGKIRLIVCVSPSMTASNETNSTLQFADRAKKAKFDRIPQVSSQRKTVPIEQYTRVVFELEKERERLQECKQIISVLSMNHPYSEELIETIRQNTKYARESFNAKISNSVSPSKQSPSKKQYQWQQMSSNNRIQRKQFDAWSQQKSSRKYKIGQNSNTGFEFQEIISKKINNSRTKHNRAVSNLHKQSYKQQQKLELMDLSLDLQEKVKFHLQQIKREIKRQEIDTSRASTDDLWKNTDILDQLPRDE